MNSIPKEMSHSKVGQEFPDILMSESDADAAKPDQHFDGHATSNSKMANEIEAMEVFRQILITGAEMSKKWSQF